MVNFSLWLLKRGNRETTVERKLKFLKSLNGSPQEMMIQVLSKGWCDKIKAHALETIRQYGEFLGVKVEKDFRFMPASLTLTQLSFAL
ncbi:hypothetical protein KEJ34_06080 [Candidatus Bathyarchaeota archaeon]|nr:hypothetical protein [Candidatus Bathyarchaeota archaeon]